MRFYDLPQEYQDLERHFPEKAFYHTPDGTRKFTEENQLTNRFNWDNTPQKHDFWAACRNAQTVAELPPIPTAQDPDPGTEVYVKDFGSEEYEKDTYYFIGYDRVGNPVCESKDRYLNSWEKATPVRQVDIDTIHTLAAKHGFKIQLSIAPKSRDNAADH